MASITVEHPDYRPGCGEKQLDRGVVLHNEAQQAFAVWEAIYTNRCGGADAYEGVNRDALAKVIAAGGVFGDLLNVAVSDAETRPATSTIGHRAERHAVAVILVARRTELTAQPVPQPTTEDTCSHGVPFSVDCADCDSEF